jgi:hypothetical protein
LKLLDGHGKIRAALASVDDGPALGLYDEKGNARAGLGLVKEGPGLTLRDETGTLRAGIGVGIVKALDGKTSFYPESSMRLFGPDGGILWSAPK